MPRDFYVQQNSPLLGMPRTPGVRQRSGVLSVQSFTKLLTSATTGTVTINDVSNAQGNTSDALLIAYGGRAGDNSPDDSLCTIEITNGTTLTATKGDSTGTAYIWGFVIHYEPGVILKKETVDLDFGTSQSKVQALTNNYRQICSLIVPCGMRTTDTTAIANTATFTQIRYNMAFSSLSDGFSQEITAVRDGSGVDNVIVHTQIVELQALT